MSQQILYRLHHSEYEHPLDAKSLDILENTRGLNKVVSKFYDLGIEKIIKLQFTGSGIRVTIKNFPDLVAALRIACEVLDAPEIPEIYIHRSEELQAVTFGVKEPIIAVTSDSVNHFSKEEFVFLFGREIAHMMSNHILYQEIGFIFPQMIDAIAPITLGLGNIVSAGLRYALFNWLQMSQYTADRGGLLACQDAYVAKLMLAKMAGLPEKYWGTFDMSSFEVQAREFEGFTEKTFDKVIRFMYGNNLWAVARASELMEWIDDGSFQQVLHRGGSNRLLDQNHDAFV
jgi:Zn-dependent protease with chaperone function